MKHLVGATAKEKCCKDFNLCGFCACVCVHLYLYELRQSVATILFFHFQFSLFLALMGTDNA